jgi:hypothetical protein
MWRMACPSSVALSAATLVLVLANFPLHAQTDPIAPVTCGAFQRVGSGGWRASEPTTLTYSNGLVLNVRRGDTFMPGQPVNGVDIASMLNRHCGGR